jgi:3-(3-hydroxy-phenyl)propionate hydroxylase
LQTGVGDAVNLGWKLGQVINGTSPDTLLDTYEVERRPVAARVLRSTLASVVMRGDDDRSRALRETMAELLAMEEPRRRFAAETSELTIRYDFGEGHPLLGLRMPDLDIETADGLKRVSDLLREARPVLLNFEAPTDLGNPLPDRVRRIHARYDGTWELPAIGVVSAPTAVLVRPDGHVAWVGEGSSTGLNEALAKWCGLAA